MASLGACQARTPAEDLQSSQGTQHHQARRALRGEVTCACMCVCVCVYVCM